MLEALPVLISQELYLNCSLSLAPQVNTSCVSGLLTPAKSFLNKLRTVLMLHLDI